MDVNDSNSTDVYNGIFYFESDHVALKGNKDYNELCRAIALLEAQRSQAIRDIDELHTKYKEALLDPIGFVNKLQNKTDLNLPNRQEVATLPCIDWAKYMNNAVLDSFSQNKWITRWKSQIDEKLEDNCTKSETGLCDDPAMMIRGRVKQEGKSETFNKLWSVEEQQKLERLLVEFPHEEVEARRHKKIAQALGTRTPQQVASRIQKYFIKLAKAKLPIPGRPPSLNSYSKKVHRHPSYQRFYQTPSTFLVSHEPPVLMSDDDLDDYDPLHSSASTSDQTSHLSDDDDNDDEIPAHLRSTREYAELMELKRLRKHKLRSSATENKSKACRMCGDESTRWNFSDCLPHDSLHLCNKCSNSQLETLHHKPSHKLKDVIDPGINDIIDEDYTQSSKPGYNYLDPNFMPAL